MAWLAALLVAGGAHLTPMRWFSTEPSSLDLLDGSPVNALLLEARAVAPELVTEATRRRIKVPALVGPDDPAAPTAAALRKAPGDWWWITSQAGRHRGENGGGWRAAAKSSSFAAAIVSRAVPEPTA